MIFENEEEDMEPTVRDLLAESFDKVPFAFSHKFVGPGTIRRIFLR